MRDITLGSHRLRVMVEEKRRGPATEPCAFWLKGKAREGEDIEKEQPEW